MSGHRKSNPVYKLLADAVAVGSTEHNISSDFEEGRESAGAATAGAEGMGRRCSVVCGAGVELWSGGLGEDGLRCGWKMIIIGVASAHGFNCGGGGRGRKWRAAPQSLPESDRPAAVTVSPARQFCSPPSVVQGLLAHSSEARSFTLEYPWSG